MDAKTSFAMMPIVCIFFFASGLSARFDWRVWAYCLVDNHYRLLVETRRASPFLPRLHPMHYNSNPSAKMGASAGSP